MAKKYTTDIDPDTLAKFSDEENYIKKSSSRYMDKVEIPVGESWLMRLLPIKLGKGQRFYARIAQHWIGRHPILCTAETHVDFGGNPDGECPICEAFAKYNGHSNKDVSDRAYKVSGQPQWLTYAVVMHKQDRKGRDIDQDFEEICTPLEFWHYKQAFQTLLSAYKRGLRRSPENSLADYEHGTNIWFTKLKRGYEIALDDSGPTPLFTNSGKMEKAIAKIEKSIILRKFTVPSDDQVEEAIDRGLDFIKTGGCAAPSSKSSGRSGRHVDDDDDDAPRTSRRHADDDDDELDMTPHSSKSKKSRDEDDDDEDEAPVKAKKKIAEDDEDDDEDEAPRKSKKSRDEDDEDDGDDDEAPRKPKKKLDDDDDDDATDDDDDDDEPASKKKPDDDDDDDDEEPAARPAGRKVSPPPAGKAKAPAQSSRGSAGDTDDDDDVTDEERDPAPPAGGADVEDEGEDGPPPRVSGGTTALNKAMRNKLKKVNEEDEED